MKKLSKKLLAILLVITMLMTTGVIMFTSSAATVTIPEDAVEFNGHYYKAFNEKMLWIKAKEYCESIGGHLATITSQEENNFVASIADGLYYFLGASDIEQENVWQWSTGEEWSYSNWYEGEPNNGTTWRAQNYLAIYGKSDSRHKHWDDSYDEPNGFICEWESGEQYPDGFDEKDCFWNFPNCAKNIEVKYFKIYYGSLIGWLLYNNADIVPGSKGVCYGMAAAASLFNGGYVSSRSIYSNIIDDYVDALGYASEPDMIKSMNMTVNDLILYSQVSRYCPTINWAINTNKNSKNIYSDLIDAVTDYVNGNGMPVVITNGSHALLACGLGKDDSSKTEIKVFDPNLCVVIKTLTLNKNESGEYTGWEYGIYNNVNSQLSYICPSSNLYSTLFKQKIARTVEHDASHNLLLIEGDYKLSANEQNMCELYIEGNSDEGKSTNNVAYWMNEETKTVLLTSKSEKTKVIFANEESAFEVIMPYETVAEIKVDNSDYDIIKLSNCNNDDILLTFRTIDSNENILSTTITGTANGDEVVATETDSGVQVSGLNNITVTYETADGTDTATANITDGRTINIVVNDDKNNVDFDWNCSHLCHSENGFMQLIWKIAKFIYKIFGMNQYCECGMAHW